MTFTMYSHSDEDDADVDVMLMMMAMIMMPMSMRIRKGFAAECRRGTKVDGWTREQPLKSGQLSSRWIIISIMITVKEQ